LIFVLALLNIPKFSCPSVLAIVLSVKENKEGSDSMLCSKQFPVFRPQLIGVGFLLVGIGFQIMGIYFAMVWMINT